MSQKTIATVSAALTLVALLPVLGLAQGTNEAKAESSQSCSAPSAKTSGGEAHGCRGHDAFNQIQGLTDDQKQQITDIKQQSKADAQALFEKIRGLKQQLASDTKPANADELSNQLDSARQQLRSQMKASHEKMMAVLSDDQKSQLAEMRQQRKAGRSNRQNPAADNNGADK